jgi:hypothetical protein
MRAKASLFVAVAVGVLLFLVAGTASAIPPTTDRFSASGSALFVSCAGFDIIVNYDFVAMTTYYYDQNGNLVRVRRYGHGTGELVNTANGNTLTGSSPSMFFDNYETQTTTQVGLILHNTIPGQGIVALDAGRVVIDWATGAVIFEGGPHPGNAGVDWCTLLA